MQYTRAFALLALLAAAAGPTHATTAATTDSSDLSTTTQATSTDGTTATDATTTGDATSTTAATSATDATTSAETTDSTLTTTATSSDATTSTSSGTSSVYQLTGLPTIAGAGIPTLVVPYTADAPFMQKSNMPEGTVFIAVGAVLAFLGACVLLWRGLVAWSVNRSVKRTANLSEKGSQWGGASGALGKSTYYKEYETGSSMSLDALTSAGKPIRNATFHNDDKRVSSAPPAGLFFSPTAQASNRASSAAGMDNRSSSYLPAGYYASPSADVAGGRSSTVIGGGNSHASLAPYARYSTVNPSPPSSPNVPNSRSTSNFYGAGPGTAGGSRDGLRRPSREALRAVSRDGYGPSRDSHSGLRAPSGDGYSSRRDSSHMYAQPSTSSLAVGVGGRDRSNENLPGQRAPSAVLDDMFENHGHGPRERF